MKLKNRRIIMFAFILTFFIMGPILLFYASGYRFDFKREKVIKTGTLLLEAKGITKANLYLNNELYEKPFSEKVFVYNLLPGDYDVRLEKDSYYSWEKKISIYSNLTTFNNNVILFKKESPRQIINGRIIVSALSPDYQKIVYLIENGSFWEFYQYNLATKENTLLARFAQGKNAELSFAASDKKVLIKIDGKYTIINIENQSLGPDLGEIIKFTPQELVWDSQSDNILYAEYKNAIYQIDIFGKKSEKIFEIKDAKIYPKIYIEASDIFFVSQGDDRDSLMKYNLNFKTTKKVLDISKSDEYQFIQNNRDYIGLIDSNQQKLYLVKKTNTDSEININSEDPVKEFNAKAAIWNKDGNQLLLYNDFEVYTFDTNSGEENMINRYGQILKKVLWYPDYAYLAVQFENSIQIIDLEMTNGTHAATEIFNLGQVYNSHFDADGKNIFFEGKIGEKTGIYQLRLR